MRKTLTGLGAALLVAAAGCSSTKLTNTWQAASAPRPVHHVLVVALARDEGVRRSLEQDMADRLGQQGLQVQRGSEFVQSGGELTADRVRALLQQTGAEAVLITELVGVEKELHYEPAGAGWYPYYANAWPGYYGPGNYREEPVVHVSTRLFGAQPGQGLLWSTTSKTFDPSSQKQAIASVNKAVVKRLDQDGLI